MIIFPIIGVFLGLFFPEYTFFLRGFHILFLWLLTLFIPFIIMSSLVISISYIYDDYLKDNQVKRYIYYYFFGTVLSVLLGFTASYIYGLGEEVHYSEFGLSAEGKENKLDIVKVLSNIIPRNIVQILYTQNYIALFLFSIFLGVVVLKFNKRKDVLAFFQLLYDLMLEAVDYVMVLIPYALLSICIHLTQMGWDKIVVFIKLFCFIISMYLIRYVILLIEIYLVGNISVLGFIKKSINYQILAFLSTSSKVTLPISIKDMKNMGISNIGVQSAISIGGVISMIGFAVEIPISVVFIANIYNVYLSLSKIIIIIISSIVGAMVGAGIPASFIIILTMILQFLNIPVDIVLMLVGLDRLLDMFSTTLNISGIIGSTLALEGRDKRLDVEKYNS